MATFKPGMRVKKIAHNQDSLYSSIPIGTEGIIIEPSPVRDWRISWDGYGPCGSGLYAVYEWQIVSLTDPKEEQWAADKVKQVTKPLMVEKPVAKERA